MRNDDNNVHEGDVLDKALSRFATGTEFQKTIEKTIVETLNKLDHKALADHMEHKVKDIWKTMALKLLGFDDRWGKLEVDHCNGRHSFVSALIQQKAKAASDEFLDRCGAELSQIIITSKIKETLKKDYDEVFNRIVRDAVREKAAAEAKTFVQTKISKVLDCVSDPIGEAIDALNIIINKTTDHGTLEILKRNLKELEERAMTNVDK